MIPITFKGVLAFLIDNEPTWDDQVDIGAEIPSVINTGLTAREDRRASADALRLSIKYSTILIGVESIISFRNSLLNLNIQNVLCPLWPFRYEAGETVDIQSEYCVLMGDGEAPEIVEYASAFGRPCYPVCIGIFSERPDPIILSDQVASVDISFTENDLSFITFPSISSAQFKNSPIFPSAPNWGEDYNSIRSDVLAIERKQIGKGRVLADAYYDQDNVRISSQNFSLQGNEIKTLFRFFADRKSTTKPFWIPVGILECLLSQNEVIGASSLHVIGDFATATFPFYLTFNGSTLACATSIAGNVLSLDSALTINVGPSTRLESAMFARFKDSKIKLSFTNPVFAKFQTSFQEVPAETPGRTTSETIGATIGALPTYAYLYTITINYPTPQVYRFTSFESDLTNGGHAYTHEKIENDDIVETANIERQSVLIRTRSILPFSLCIPFTLEWPMIIDICEADVSSGVASNLTYLFHGEFSDCNSEGPFLELTFKSLSSVYDRLIPSQLFQASCNWVLFSTGCGLLKANWEYLSTISIATSTTLTIGTLTKSGNPVSVADHFFSGGYIEITSGETIQYKLISDNVGSLITLSAYVLTQPQAGDAIKLYPGCSGDYAICGTKFGNASRFGGFPFIPVGNPTILSVKQSTSGSGKK